MTLQLYYCINTLFTDVCILRYKLKVTNDIEYVFDLKMKVSDSNLYFRRISSLHMINPVTGEDLSRCETVNSPITDAQYTPPMEDLEDSWSLILAVIPSVIDTESSVS